MGLGSRRPFLPAATDSLLASADDTPVEPDLATDLSRRTDRSSHTLPADGSPITITTAQKKTGIGKLVKPGSLSQTSLLIEYFENGRVKVTPSSRKGGGVEGQIIGSEPAGVRGTSQKHRILLGTESNLLDDSVSAVDSELPFGRSKAPVEIEVYQGSDLSVHSETPDPRYLVTESDISSMPGDSILSPSRPVIMTQPAPSSSLNKSEVSEISELSEKENLRPPVIPSGYNKSSERLARNVIEKITNKPRASATKSALSDTSRSRSSISREVEVPEPRRRTAKNIEDDSITGTASSLVSGSALSTEPRAVDQRSVRSGNSNVSINNPKLLQTVEDAIRRLILPELKEIKKETRHGSTAKRHKDIYPSDSYDSSSVSREETSRRRSSGGKTKRRSTGREHGHRVSSSSRRSSKTVENETPSDLSYQKSESVETASVDGYHKPRKHHKSHRAKDATAGAIAGAALTAAALKHHESGSSLDHRERRKKRSKSRSSRSASVAESEEIFNKHDVPPMPMRSDLGSELTRSSLLSSNTAGTATPTRREVREVVRGSPHELLSPSSQTPSRTPVEKSSPNKALNIQRGLGTHHGNLSEHDLATHRRDDEDDESTEHATPEFARDGFASLGQTLLTDPERAKAYERNLHTQHPIRRGLSPIQSVASYTTTEPNRTSLIQPRSTDSLSSEHHERDIKEQVSIASLSSANSVDLAKSRRPQGLSLENRSEIMIPHKDGTTRGLDADDFYEDQHSQNDQYRDSYVSEPRSVESPYLDKVTSGQHLGQAYRANPEYVQSPIGVESAVASLYEPSMMDSRSNLSPAKSNHADFVDHYETESQHSLDRDFEVRNGGSPLKQQLLHSQTSLHSLSRDAPLSPVQSVTRSATPPLEMPAAVKALETAVPGPTTETQDATSPESEITTNPSVIQGPIAGYEHGNRDHWPYGPTPPPVKDGHIPGSNRDLGLAGQPDLMPEALSINHPPPPERKRTIHITAPPLESPGMIDEGYDTQVPNGASPAPMPRERAVPAAESYSPGLQMDDDLEDEEDPFTSQKKNQYISGLSQGMSPLLYDSATGKGLDRIESKDIVALMDHLTVRDAHRNARDTEILVTLVRTAAEMRNSFEDMQKFIAEQHDMILDTSDKQHERTQKAIGGPRPAPPPASARFTRTPASVSEEEDLPAKRRNIFRRAVKGLGTKNTAELQNIEGMLMQLLDDVAGLRTVQTGGLSGNEPHSTSFSSTDNARLPTDPGYEPEGQAGTSSTGGRSGIFSNSSSRQANYQTFGRQGSGNRVSTVMEGDEEYDDQALDQAEQTTPKASFARGASEPLRTPPRMQPANQGSLSNDHTPHYSTEGSSGKKHKSFASWLLPNKSRWSKTTASSTGDYRASTQARPRPFSGVSQSGSHLEEFDYDHHGDDRLRSNTSLQNEQYQNENRPPSPLIPSEVSDNNPKYQAHRNSMNLQHPQPRQGPTGRYQHHLESEAQYYNNENEPISPSSVTSSQWEAQAGATAMPNAGPTSYTHGGHLSPISDGGYSETSAAMLDRDGRPRSISSQNRQGPPHPPKIPHDNSDPLVPQRPPKLPMGPQSGNKGVTYVDQVAAARAGSPALDKSPMAAMRNSPGQTRKPSGPRPLSSSGQYATGKGTRGDMNVLKKTRFRGSPYHISDTDDGVGS